MIASEREHERGISLVELLVAMMLFGLILTLVGGMFVAVARNQALARGISQNTGNASNAMNESARVIRAATENPKSGSATSDPAFVDASAESVTVYAYINTDSTAERPVMIRLSIDAQRRLVESRWPATALASGYWGFPCTPGVACTTAPTTTRVLASAVAGGSVPFRYLQADGTEISAPAGGFPATQLATITAVTVTLTIQSSTTDASNAVTLVNTVGIPNLGRTRTGF